MSAFSAERMSSSRCNLMYIVTAQMLFSGTFLAVGIYLVHTLGPNIQDIDELGLDLHIFAYFFLMLASLVGTYATYRRNRLLVTMYFSMTLAQIVLGIGSGSFCLSLLMEPTQPDEIQKCRSLDHFSRSFCERDNLMRGLAMALFLQIWVIECLGIYTAQEYVQELLQEGPMKDIYEYEYEYDC